MPLFIDPLGSKRIGLINYSTGNTASVAYFLERLDLSYVVVSTAADLSFCDAAILPGVGHFHTACQSLRASGLFYELQRLSSLDFPLIGICLGFQLMTLGSEESSIDSGLGIFPFHTFEIKPKSPNFKVPHIGWNSLDASISGKPLFQHIDPCESFFFYANRFGVRPNSSCSVDQTKYTHSGQWLAVAHQGNSLGVQFHPEKSRSNGYLIMKNFFKLAFNSDRYFKSLSS